VELSVSVGVDVGGTFTDVISFDSRTGDLSVLKFPTSADPTSALSSGLKELGVDPSQVSILSHATTLATNALLTRSGLPRTALVTNAGFRDVLEIGRQRRPEVYNLSTRRPAPLVERKDRFTVKGRVSADGSELEPLDPADADSVSSGIGGANFDSVAISFLHSYLNDSHERKMRDTLLRLGFRGHISISSEVDREYREYERTSTTVVNAVLSPLMTQYLTRLDMALRRLRLGSQVYIMGSDGGANKIGFVSRRPVVALESGPAAGVTASRHMALRLALDRVLTFDMGGTTAKAGTVIDGKPEVTGEFEAAGRTHSGRSVKGSGYPVRGRFIDLAEVSAGGGTVAWIDQAGGLKAGPRSAGSNPGPACYGRGGKEPTVTDANVLLGRLNPESLLGGAMPIQLRLAKRSIGKLADAMGESSENIAKGILRLVNDTMARAISIVSVERGRDPRDFTLFAFGGAGPAHSCDLSEELGIRDVVVPIHAGLFSAYGLLVGEFTRTFSAPVLQQDPRLRRAFSDLEASVEKEMKAEGFPLYSSQREVEARYYGQSHELILPYGEDSTLKRSFDSLHRALYGYSSSDPMEVVNISIRAVVPRSVGDLKANRGGKPSEPSVRLAWVGGRTRKVKVLQREALVSGANGVGPCIIEEYDSTLVVNPGWKWRTEDYGTRLTQR
jgi:N-methylhydantoinase A